MTKIWSEEGKLARWLDVELAALEGWAELGRIPPEAVAAIRARATTPTPERVAEIERVTDHDVAAFVDAVAEELGPEGRWFHYGLTSSDVVRLEARGLGFRGRSVARPSCPCARGEPCRPAVRHSRDVRTGRAGGRA